MGKRGTFCFLAYEAVYPYCNWLNGECDGNGTVSFADIGCFVNLVGQGGSGVTRAYTWDAENRLTRVGPAAGREAVDDIQLTFRYDYLGRRVEKQVSTWSGTAWTVTQTRRYVWDGWRMLLEMDGSGTILRKYTWGLDLAGLNGQVNSLEGAGAIGGLLAVQVVGGAVGGGDLNYAYLYDANGNVGQLVDWAHDANDPAGALVAKYEYDPYGGVTAATGSYAADNVWRFSTKQFDADTGLGYWGYRYYSPTLGRWISRDPIEERGGPALYCFAGNEPVAAVDPLGFVAAHQSTTTQACACCCCCAEDLTLDNVKILKFGDSISHGGRTYPVKEGQVHLFLNVAMSMSYRSNEGGDCGLSWEEAVTWTPSAPPKSEGTHDFRSVMDKPGVVASDWNNRGRMPCSGSRRLVTFDAPNINTYLGPNNPNTQTKYISYYIVLSSGCRSGVCSCSKVKLVFDAVLDVQNGKLTKDSTVFYVAKSCIK